MLGRLAGGSADSLGGADLPHPGQVWAHTPQPSFLRQGRCMGLLAADCQRAPQQPQRCETRNARISNELGLAGPAALLPFPQPTPLPALPIPLRWSRPAGVLAAFVAVFEFTVESSVESSVSVTSASCLLNSSSTSSAPPHKLTAVLRAMAALRAVCCAAVWFLLCVGIGYPVMYVVESA